MFTLIFGIAVAFVFYVLGRIEADRDAYKSDMLLRIEIKKLEATIEELRDDKKTAAADVSNDLQRLTRE